MRFSSLLKALPDDIKRHLPIDPEIRGIVYDPLRVEPGFLYVAINIYTQLNKVELPDGHPFIDLAIKKGAVAVVVQQNIAVPQNIARIIVPDTRRALAFLANRFYGEPWRHFKLLGITGTNGKTTTTHIVENIFSQRHRFGLIGTLYYKIAGNILKSKDTTPEPPDLQQIFLNMKQAKLDYCIMEVSSHGIDFSRVADLEFTAGIFTNLSQDHLDYHKTMENYRDTKLRFFRELPPNSQAFVNIDDDNGERFANATEATVMTYGLQRSADIMAKEAVYRLDGTDFLLCTPKGNCAISSPLIGAFNVYNALAAAAVAFGQGFTLEEIKTGLEKPLRVAGRLEKINCGQPFAVIVDYAHSPQSMQSILQMARSMAPSRIISVFGCGGDRDPGKRPQMGAISAQYSDISIVTSDNPRNEDPQQIIKHILDGMSGHNYLAIVDRREAIEKAVSLAMDGDMLLILGKGHETTQTIGPDNLPFDDRQEARAALGNAGYRGD